MSLNIAGSVQSLLHPVATASRVITPHPTWPVLGCIKITGKGDHAEIVGTNNQVTIRTIARDVVAEGEGLIQAAKLQSLLKSIPIGSQRVAITADSTSVMIQCGGKYKCASIALAEFPDVRTDLKVEEEGINLKTDLLIDAMQQVSHAMARQDVRYYLNGALLDCHEGVIDCVATDGHRLSRRSINAPSTSSDVGMFIIPSSTVGIVTKVLTSDLLVVSAGHNRDDAISHIIFESGDTWVASTLLDGKYPDYKRVIPTRYMDEVKIHRQELIDACHRCQIFSDQKGMGVTIKINSAAVLSCESIGGEDFAEEEIPITRKGTQELTILLSSPYLLEGISNFDSEYIVLKYDSPEKIGVTPYEDSVNPDDIEVIMGMRA